MTFCSRSRHSDAAWLRVLNMVVAGWLSFIYVRKPLFKRPSPSQLSRSESIAHS